ncbi:carbohydrate ABC transporter permease (plasmid) [Bosea vestrisii]|uniref:carbohydrate ABC transporter permease n=1 Tax=Bosea vestrisii TaxID=151416 RepID=UPI0024E01A54|nr:carbohydrate ABC transporter permease [Bosea vestrisii]WID99940.1 carbohydrate ABC transporter permease [Bosea vestrisii]
MVLTAFRQPVDTLAMRFVFAPTLDGFRTIFVDSNFQLYLQNSLLTAIPTTLAVLLLAAPAAYSLAHLNKRSRLFLGSVLVARMVPGIAILIPLYLAASRAGLLDRRLTLIVVYCAFNLPFAVWLLRGFFREIPNELREAAIVDGCSEFQVFWKIMVPLVGGGLVATSVFVFIGAWNEFLFALALTQSNAATAPLAVIGFRNEYGVQWGAIGAAAVMISTPVVAFAVVMQKYLVRGLTMGAVKG